MKTVTAWSLLVLFPLTAFAQQAVQSWRQVTVPTVDETAAAFAQPPREYGAIHWAIWGGQQSKDRILADIKNVDANGGGVYMINNSRGLLPKYFTPEYLDLVKFVVDECKKRGMKVWIEGDAGYPDGFAGGMISKEYPQLGMQGIVPDAHCAVAGGQTISFPLPTDTLGIIATEVADAGAPAAGQGKSVPIPADGNLKWLGPSGSTWEVRVQEANGVTVRYSVMRRADAEYSGAEGYE